MDPRNPSVPDAREFDRKCPGGKAHYIVFYRQSRVEEGVEYAADWIVERTSDKFVMESGTLSEMLLQISAGTYPYARRATWAEDTLRLKPNVFYMSLSYGED